MPKVIIPLVPFTREEQKKIVVARDKRCVFTGREGTDAHEVIFKRSDKHGEGNKSWMWHPYNTVLLWNPYHIDGGATSALHSLLHLQHLLDWHGEEELNKFIDWAELRVKPINIEQWAWQRAVKIKPEANLTIQKDRLYLDSEFVGNLRYLSVKHLTL